MSQPHTPQQPSTYTCTCGTLLRTLADVNAHLHPESWSAAGHGLTCPAPNCTTKLKVWRRLWDMREHFKTHLPDSLREAHTCLDCGAVYKKPWLLDQVKTHYCRHARPGPAPAATTETPPSTEQRQIAFPPQTANPDGRMRNDSQDVLVAYTSLPALSTNLAPSDEDTQESPAIPTTDDTSQMPANRLTDDEKLAMAHQALDEAARLWPETKRLCGLDDD